MSIAITEEHQEIARVARAFLESNKARAESRELLSEKTEKMPSFWNEMAKLGWMGIHVDEKFGGQGFGIPELTIVLEEQGRAVAPGPYLPTTLAAAVLSEAGSDATQSRYLPCLAEGSAPAAVGLNGSLSLNGTLNGSAGLVMGAGLAKVLLLAVGDDIVILDRDQDGLSITPLKNIDRSRRACTVSCENIKVSPDNVLKGARSAALRLARTLSAAEAAGGARACLEMATEYAKVREQFGRPIGMFQAVKHHCANMLIETEKATAAAWGAAREGQNGEESELSSAFACALALPAFVFCAETNIQVHGGIGFTWEHDAHLFLRRANALSALMGPVDRAREDITRLAGKGIKSRTTIDLPPEAEAIRKEVRKFVEEYKALPEDQKRKVLCDSGYFVPHWPKPWGRQAGPIEQLVIEEEFAGVNRPSMGISAWNTLTIAQNGSPEQVERWVRPSLEGELRFCQLFSEPDAGSDAAAVKTRGVKVDGGWRVTGQKVWTSEAQICNRGFATVRTDPDAPKHQGISMMVIDLNAEGVEVRPLRQITGHSHFNEVFLDGVFVPDSDVVGEVNEGWTVARNTLGNERVSLSGGKGVLGRGPNFPKLLAKHAPDDVGIAREVGAAMANREADRLLNLRSVVRAVVGAQQGAEANVTKLLLSEVDHESTSLAARIVGELAAVTEGYEARIGMELLQTRGISIAGGTSEILRNQIAERILDLPRDPLLN